MLSKIIFGLVFFGAGIGCGQYLVPKETAEPPLADVQGPFRPRPRPTPPAPDPLPEPQDDAERKLFPRIQAILDAHAARVEARCVARSEETVNQGFEDAAQSLSGASLDSDLAGFGGSFIPAIVAFVKKAAIWAVKLVVVSVLGALVIQYWFLVAPTAAFLFIALPAWSARTFVKQQAPTPQQPIVIAPVPSPVSAPSAPPATPAEQPKAS